MAKYVATGTYYVEMEIDPDVIAVALTPEWQADFYKFADEQDVVEHLAYNLAMKDRSLSRLDGWADRSDDDAKVTREEYDHD